MPAWPSMLKNLSRLTFQPMFAQPVQPIQPMLPTPVSATSTSPTPTPRKTLTDLDRKRMCQYAEEHPNAKQTEIGGIFGVERSTVSKVLRRKEKYLFQDDGSRSPIKRAKGRTPDVEKALGVWARNQERNGLLLTDEAIREKARAFASTSSTPESQQSWSSSWMEKFKQKNNLLGARPGIGSLAPESAELFPSAAWTSHTQSLVGTSSVSLQGIGSPFHSQSATSLNSAFTDNTQSTFSPGPLSPTSPSYTPDSGTVPGLSPPLTARPILPAPTSSNAHRPRSQTFPQMDHCMGGTSSTETSTTQSQIAGVLDFSMEEALETIPCTNDSREITFSPYNSSLRGITSAADALRGLQVVHEFIEQQPEGFLDYSESVTVGKLMEKLKLRCRANTNA
ncbi:hypothetical protein LTR56_028012 [Elasticomyces elasticus]|nr:hypothetical protein LTR56_028012 [Elasticomyces elasticus]